MSFPAYKLFCEILFKSDKLEHVDAQAFLTLEWNIISRNENCIDCEMDHIYFHHDALMLDFGKTKTDQEGTKTIDHPWHVYDNPLCPMICPVLALSKHVFTNPSVLSGMFKVFEGDSQYKRFNKTFKSVVNDHYSDFAVLGFKCEDFVTHSIC